ncbi:MAG: serine hydrolase domain-containing protein, partial [Pseudomonadota bacterium]
MLKRLLSICLLFLGLSLNPIYAQPSQLEKQDLEPFIDGVMSAHLRDFHIPGAVIAVVKDDELLFAKGYGYADLAEKRPVDPEKTLFRVASITKLFVWTALMQMVETDQLDLDEDVNTYLTAFKIPETFPEPITLRHFLTHTPGFEDKAIGLMPLDSDSMTPPLADILAREMPQRVHPPGTIPLYSNYGVAVVGHIIAQQSGMSFPEYLEQNILQPLDMQHTTLRQPVPSTLRADLATGYQSTGGRPRPRPFEFWPLAPAAGLSTTATDIAKFMLAHLQGGKNLLKPETATLLHSPELAGDFSKNGGVHGFMEQNRNGIRTLSHGGSTIFFKSRLILAPEHQLGLFVSYNGNRSGAAASSLVRAFFDRYYPHAEPNKPTLIEGFQTRASKLVGTYMASRRNHSTYESLSRLGGFGLLSVEVSDNDSLILYEEGAASEWLELEPLLYRRADGVDTLQFGTDAQGQASHVTFENGPAAFYKKLVWYEQPGPYVAFLVFVLVTAIASILMTFRTFPDELPVGFVIRRLASFNGVLCTLFFGGFFWLLIAVGDNLVFGEPWYLTLLFILPWL